jgi:hypothetical protein
MKRISGHFPTGTNPNAVLINLAFQRKQIFQVASVLLRESFLVGGNRRKPMQATMYESLLPFLLASFLQTLLLAAIMQHIR